MAIKIAGVQLGNISGGPSSLTLEDLADVSVTSPQTGQYLRYNGTISEWQNSYINSDVYSYLSTNMTGSSGIVLTYLSGPETIDIGLSLTVSGDATGTSASGNIPITLATVNSNVGTYGSSTLIPIVTVNAKGLITGVTTTTYSGSVSSATNLAGGASGNVPYQTAPSTTGFVTNAAGVLQAITSGATPAWTTTPTLTGTNFTGIPNAALANSSLTVGSTNIALGATSTTLAGLTSVTSTTFVGALSGNATTATSATTATNIAGGLAGNIHYQSAVNTTALLATGTSSQVLVSGATPAWTNTPTLTGTNFTSIPNAALTNSSTTIGSTAIALGATSTTLAGLTSVTSTTFVGALTGAASLNVLKAGDTMSGLLLLSGDPVAALGAVTKQYADAIASGVNIHIACETATTAALATCTYNNGASGVGATLTATTNIVLGTIGGYASLAVGSRLLVKNQASGLQNGIYVVTSLGSAGVSPWQLTRATDFDGSPASEVAAGDLTYIQSGTLNGTQWVETATGTGSPGNYIIIGTDALVFTQFSGAGSYTAGVGIDITSNVISNTGVLSNIAGTNIAVSGATGNVTISVTGTVPTATTSTNIAGGVAGNVHYQSGVGTTAFVTNAAGVLQAASSGATPTWTTTPTLTGTNFTGIPNAGLTNSSLTLGSTSMALGSTTTTVAGLSSVTSTTFVGALTGNSSTATNVSWAGLTGPATSNTATATINTSQVLRGHFDTSATNGQTLFSITEDVASTKAGIIANRARLLTVNTLSGSTCYPFSSSIGGTNVFSVNNLGSLSVAGLAAASGNTAGTVSIVAGTGDATFAGGNLSISSGSGTGAGSGLLTIAAGSDSGTGVGGSILVQSGASTSGTHGNIVFKVVNGTITVLTLNADGTATFGSTVTAPTFVGALTGAASLNVLKTGDTMTGDLAIVKASTSAVLSLDAGADAMTAATFFKYNGLVRWREGKLNNSETGSNVGSDFNIARYNDAGTFVDIPLTIKRDTGDTLLTGSLALGTTAVTGYTVRASGTITGATTAHGVGSTGTVQSDVTVQANGFFSSLGTQATAFTVATLNQFYATQSTLGAGSAITNHTGFYAGPLTNGTNNFGFSGNLTANATRWNAYMGGTAQNYFLGNVGIGSGKSAPATALDVNGTTTSTIIAANGPSAGLLYSNNTSVSANSRNFVFGQTNSFGTLDIRIGATLGSDALSGSIIQSWNATGSTVVGTLAATTFSGSGASLTNIPNAALTNSSVTVNGTAIALGASGTVTAAAGTLTGATLNATVTASSLTSVGTLGTVTVTNTATVGTLAIDTTGIMDSAVLVTSTTTSNQVVDTKAIATYRAVKYQITVTSGSAYEYTEVQLLHDGTTAYINEINTMLTGAALATFDADISAGNLRLLVTPVNAITTIKSIVTAIAV